MKHLTGNLLRAPVLWLPLLGAAYSRAKESTCDRHGRACCESPESAARALVALAAGAQRWRMVDLPAFEAPATLSRGLRMLFHELVGGHPWLTKRVARVLHPDAPMPARNGFAYVFALFTPYAGRGGGAAGLIIVAALIGVLAAVALPACKDYQARAQFTLGYVASEPARSAVAAYYAGRQSIPRSLDDVGVPSTLADGTQLSLDADTMALTVDTPVGPLVFMPQAGDDGRTITWQCTGGDGVPPSHLPAQCRQEAAAGPRR